MPKNNVDKSVLKALKKSLGVKSKQLALKLNKDGTYDLKVQSLSQHNLDKIITLHDHADAPPDLKSSEVTDNADVPDHVVLTLADQIHENTQPNQVDNVEASLHLCDCIHCVLTPMIQDYVNAIAAHDDAVRATPSRKSLSVQAKKKIKNNRKPSLDVLQRTCRTLMSELDSFRDHFPQIHLRLRTITYQPKSNTLSYYNVHRKKIQVHVPTKCEHV